jgi:hypothetical protein
MDRETLISALQSGSVSSFLEEHIFDRVPYFFGGDRLIPLL